MICKRNKTPDSLSSSTYLKRSIVETLKCTYSAPLVLLFRPPFIFLESASLGIKIKYPPGQQQQWGQCSKVILYHFIKEPNAASY